MNHKSFELDGLTFFDAETSQADYWVTQEENFNDLYNINFFENDVILEIGSHVGTISLPICKSNPEILCIGYEANINNYRNLIRGIAENDVKNFIPNFCGVHSKSGEILQSRFRKDNSGATSFFNENVNENSNYISTLSLDDILKIYKLKNIKVFKMDCEGSEYNIIYNSEKLKDTEIDYMYIEIHNYPNQDFLPPDLVKYIEEKLKVKHFNYKITNCENWMKNESYD